MYDRTPRILTRAATSTAPNVGPGVYYRDNKAKNWSYAPFQSMKVRESFLTIDEGTAAAPGPAHYSPPTNLSTVKGGNSLSNKSRRFLSLPSTTPGPGTYSISSSLLKATPQNNTGKVSQIKFQRQGNAPSIPSTGFNNGYEEDSCGTLKPQEIPSSDSTLGPAYYNLPLSHMELSAIQKYKGIHFGNLSSNRTVFEEHYGPGPGNYSPIVNTEGRSYGSKFKPTNILRYHELVAKEEQVKGVPGPGQYDLKSQFEEEISSKDTCDSELEKAPFGSRLQRFLTEKQHSPASTTYQDPRTAFTSIHRLHGIKQTPFSQSSKRFKSNQSDYPGPGTYNDNYTTGMTSQLMRKAMLDGQKTPFGSTSVRTVPLTKKDELQMPGPADYQDNKAESPRYKNRSHTFASTSKRLYSPTTDNPPPGLYEVAKASDLQAGKLDTSSVKTGFLSTSERFAPPGDVVIEGPDTFNPGPAEYQVMNQRKQPGGVICSEMPRFKEPKAITPGPGTYQLSKSQRDTLLLGTYNVKLLNPLTEDRNPNTTAKLKKSVLIGV